MFGLIAILAILVLGHDVYKSNRDIENLYSSRDSLWRELNNEIQARKRQNSLLRGRIHGLREKLKNRNIKWL